MLRSVIGLGFALAPLVFIACSGGEFSDAEGATGGQAGSPGTGGSDGGTAGNASGGSAGATGGRSGGGTSGTGTGGVSSGGSSGSGGASTGGVAGVAGVGGAVSETCGGFIGLDCPGDKWCNFDESVAPCGNADVSGRCVARPMGCDLLYAPVCGCDGAVYSNECAANAAGMDITGDTSCFPVEIDSGVSMGGCTSDSDCANGERCCYPCGIPGCQNECMPTMGAGCPLFP